MKLILSQPDNTVQGTYTSFHQVTVITTKAKITKAIGFEPAEVMDKAQYEWEVQVQPEDKEPYLAYIYDWKESQDIEDNDRIVWHIGTQTKEQSIEVKRALEALIG